MSAAHIQNYDLLVTNCIEWFYYELFNLEASISGKFGDGGQ